MGDFECEEPKCERVFVTAKELVSHKLQGYLDELLARRRTQPRPRRFLVTSVTSLATGSKASSSITSSFTPTTTTRPRAQHQRQKTKEGFTNVRSGECGGRGDSFVVTIVMLTFALPLHSSATKPSTRQRSATATWPSTHARGPPPAQKTRTTTRVASVASSMTPYGCSSPLFMSSRRTSPCGHCKATFDTVDEVVTHTLASHSHKYETNLPHKCSKW